MGTNTINISFWIRWHIFCIGLSLTLIQPNRLEAEVLPRESQRLIDLLKQYELKEQEMLKQYELREREKTEAKVSRKRREVLVILRKHLKQRTQDSQLDKALAIRKEIERLEVLTTIGLEERIPVAEISYIRNGVVSNKKAGSYMIDVDEDGGKIILRFKHRNLTKLFNTYKKSHVKFVISKNKYADSVDSVLLRYKSKTLSKKDVLKQGEVVKLAFAPWKIALAEDTLGLTIENTGKDGFVVIGSGTENAPELVFEK